MKKTLDGPFGIKLVMDDEMPEDEIRVVQDCKIVARYTSKVERSPEHKVPNLRTKTSDKSDNV